MNRGTQLGQKEAPPVSLSLRVSASVIIALAVQSIALIVGLVQMHSNVVALQMRVTELDQAARRTVILEERQAQQVLPRLAQHEADNKAQDVRTTALEGKVNDIERKQIENKYWIDQLVQFMRMYSHPQVP